MSNVVYTSIMTLSGSNKVICRFASQDPFLVLADAMAKIWIPIARYFIDFKPRIHFRYDLVTDPHPLAGEGDFLSTTLWASHAMTHEPFYSLSIGTHLTTPPAKEGVQWGSDPFYLSAEYMTLVSTFRDRILRWTNGSLPAAKALCSLAAIDLYHDFWEKPAESAKRAGLSF